MKKSGMLRVYVGYLIILWVCQFFNPAIAVASITPLPKYITLENPQDLKSKIFPGLIFTHLKHYRDYEISCLTCHHNWITEGRDNPRKCIECHKPFIDDTNREAVLLRNAYHRCCKACHTDLRERGKYTAPTKCRGCHVLARAGKK